MAEMQNRPRDEKEEEKKREKEEKGRSDSLNTLTWGAIFIWAGLVFLADNMGLLASLQAREPVPGFFFLRLEAWALIFIGAGIIVLIEAAIRYLVPTYRRAVTGTVILGIVFLGIGLGNLTTWSIIWPLVLIALGILVLLRGMGWRK